MNHEHGGVVHQPEAADAAHNHHSLMSAVGVPDCVCEIEDKEFDFYWRGSGAEQNHRIEHSFCDL